VSSFYGLGVLWVIPGARTDKVLMNTKLRVKQAFDAKAVASRRREKFGPGELLMLVECPGSPAQSNFVRINGLRPDRGVECLYTLESDQLSQVTEVAKLAQ
jgi:hypothetical protein